MRFMRIAFILLLLFPGVIFAQVSVYRIEASVAGLSQALKTKDTGAAEEFLSPGFSVHAVTMPLALQWLESLLGHQPVESLELSSADFQVDGDALLADVVITLSDGKMQATKLAFDADGKVLYIDYFDRLYGGSRFQESRFAGTIPFEQDGNSIVLLLRLNDSDQTLRFLLDTGADGMAIRKSLADSLGLVVAHTQTTHMVGGQQQVGISRGNRVYLSDSIVLREQNIAIFPEYGKATDGIIGLNLVRQYVVTVDYDRRQIDLYTFGRKRAYDGLRVPVSMPHGLIVLPAAVDLTGDKLLSGKVIMDTGANYYLILFSRFVRKNRLLLSGFKPESQSATVSLGVSTPVYNGRAAEFRLGDEIVQRDILITLQASSGGQVSRPNEPEGSLGVGFFSGYNFTIDLLQQEIHLVPRKKSN